jgi:hypothetical protein
MAALKVLEKDAFFKKNLNRGDTCLWVGKTLKM